MKIENFRNFIQRESRFEFPFNGKTLVNNNANISMHCHEAHHISLKCVAMLSTSL